MLAAECVPGSAVTVRAVDDFYRFIDGWRGVIADMPSAAGAVWITCPSPRTLQQEIGPLLHFLVPPEQLERIESD